MGLSRRQAGKLTAEHRKQRASSEALEGVNPVLEAMADELLGECRKSSGVLNKRQMQHIRSREVFKGLRGVAADRKRRVG